MIEQEIKEALKEKGETFSSLEKKLGKSNNFLSKQIKGWAKRFNDVLQLIGYELAIKPTGEPTSDKSELKKINNKLDEIIKNTTPSKSTIDKNQPTG